jgi:hypothetical protein
MPAASWQAGEKNHFLSADLPVTFIVKVPGYISRASLSKHQNHRKSMPWTMTMIDYGN